MAPAQPDQPGGARVLSLGSGVWHPSSGLGSQGTVSGSTEQGTAWTVSCNQDPCLRPLPTAASSPGS